MVGVAGGLALTGLRPIVHSYAPFLVERAYEQIKLDLDHQGVGAVLVSIGASYDRAAAGRTHLSPADVALIDTLDGWTVHVPGHPDEVPPLLRDAVAADDSAYLRLSTPQQRPGVPGRRRRAAGGAATPGRARRCWWRSGRCCDAALAAVADLAVTVAYTHRPRPFDTAGLRALAGDRGDPGGALPGRNVGAGGVGGPGGPAAPAAGARRGPRGAAPLRLRRGPRPGGTGWTPPGCAARSASS